MINLIALLIILAVFSIFFGYISKDLFVGLASGFFSDNAIFIHPIHEIMLETEFSLDSNIKTLPIIVTVLSFLYYNNKAFLSGGMKMLTIISVPTIGAALILNNFLNSTSNILIIVILTSVYILIKFITDNSKNYLIKLILYIFTLVNINLRSSILISMYKNNIVSTATINTTNFFNQRLFFELFYNKFISGTALNLGGQTTKFLDKGSIEYVGPYGLEVGLLHISKKISKLDSGIITSYALYILSGLVIYLYVLNFMNIDELILITFISIIYILIK